MSVRTSVRIAAVLAWPALLVALVPASLHPGTARRGDPAVAAGLGLAAPAPSEPDAASLDVYAGLGTWVDLYDVAWRHPRTAVRRMSERGVDTLYLETSNFSRGSPFVFRDEVERFLDAAHRNGIAVVAWYLPGLRDVALDLRRSIAAVRLRTDRGNSFDSFALDIESDVVKREILRTKRLLRLSARLRAEVGGGYSLGAIIPSPRRLRDDVSYWPRFPYRRLAEVFDVFLPMTYFTFQVTGRDGARWYTVGNIDIIRRETGDPSVPIHVIGGIGGDATRAETAGFVDAVHERRVIGGSYYTFPLTSEDDWSKLERLRSIR